MSVADGLAWNEEDGSAILSTLTIFGTQADVVAVRKDLACLENRIRKNGGRSITDAFVRE